MVVLDFCHQGPSMTPTYRTTITQPPRPAVYGDWPAWAYPPLIAQLADEYGITRPYR